MARHYRRPFRLLSALWDGLFSRIGSFIERAFKIGMRFALVYATADAVERWKTQ
jgi:hypothetical protein